MGAIPSANYYESDIDIYRVNQTKNSKTLSSYLNTNDRLSAQRHSYFDTSFRNVLHNSTTRLKSLPNSKYPSFRKSSSNKNGDFHTNDLFLTNSELEENRIYCQKLNQKLEIKSKPAKKSNKLNKLFTFGHKNGQKSSFIKSKSSHNISSKNILTDALTTDKNIDDLNKQQNNHEEKSNNLKLLVNPNKNIMDESLGGVTSRSGSMSMLSSSYSIKSRMSNHNNKASTPTDDQKKLTQNSSKNNTSCSSGCSSAASSTNLSRTSRISQPSTTTNRPDSSLSSISTGYQSSSINHKNNTKHDRKRNSKQEKVPVLDNLVKQQALNQVNHLFAAKTEYDLFNVNYLQNAQSLKNFSLNNNASTLKSLMPQVLVEGEIISSTSSSFASSKKPVKKLSEQKNSFSSLVLNKLGTYLKSSSKLNETSHYERGNNRRGIQNRMKSKSMFVESDSPLNSNYSDNNQKQVDLSPLKSKTKKSAKLLKKRFSLKLRKSVKKNRDRTDSGILTDIFHLGSVSNLKQKLTNATSVLRQSFSVFNLKSSPQVASSSKSACKSSLPSEITNFKSSMMINQTDFDIFRTKSQFIERGKVICDDETDNDEQNYAEIEENVRNEDDTDFDYNEDEEEVHDEEETCSVVNYSNNNLNNNIINSFNNKLKNYDILKANIFKNNSIACSDLEKSEHNAPSNSGISDFNKFDSYYNSNNKNVVKYEKNFSKDDSEISTELAIASSTLTVPNKILENKNNCIEKNDFSLTNISNSKNLQQKIFNIPKSIAHFDDSNSIVKRRSSLISSTSSADSASSSFENSCTGNNSVSSASFSSISKFQSKLKTFRNNFEMSGSNIGDQADLIESSIVSFKKDMKTISQTQECSKEIDKKYGSLRRTSTFHSTLNNQFNTIITPKPNIVINKMNSEFGSMANLIEERLIEKRRQYLMNQSNSSDISISDEKNRLLQTINTNKEFQAYNNNTKFSINAFINSNSNSISSNRNHFVSHCRNNNTNRDSILFDKKISNTLNTSEIPNLTAVQHVQKSNKLTNSKTSGLITLKENSKCSKPFKNHINEASMYSSSVKIIPNQIPIMKNSSERNISSIVSKTSNLNLSSKSSNHGQSTHRHQKIVVQASTSDLLRCFASFISQRFSNLFKDKHFKSKFDARETIAWLRMADRALLIQGWQDVAFLNPVNVIFFFMMVRDSLKPNEIHSVYDLQCHIMACLYLAFSYMGNEISYPLKPFLVEVNRDLFWQRTITLMNQLSGNMLKVNQDPRFFTELFYELKSYNVHDNQCLTSPNCDNSISTFKYVQNTNNSSSTISFNDNYNIDKNLKFNNDKFKENEYNNNHTKPSNKNLNYNKFASSTFNKPTSSSQLINKTNKDIDDPSILYKNIQNKSDLIMNDSLVSTSSVLPKLDVSKLKPQYFNFLSKNDQYVMYGPNNEDSNLTYCI